MSRPAAVLVRVLFLVGVPCLLLVATFGWDAARPTQLARNAAGDGTWTYEIRPGDVLGTIAQRELGTFRRFKEIEALNPGIEARALTVGDSLRMPPRDPAAASARPKDGAPASTGGLLWTFLAMVLLVGAVVAASRYLERRAYA
jgi:hypothetical protein